MKRCNLNHQFILLLLLTLMLLSCTNNVYHSLWQTKTMLIDGIANEWGNPLKYYDNSSKLQYAFTNDSENLYVCIKTIDEFTQFRIMHAGIDIGIDTTGNMKKQAVISFPMSNKENKDNMPPPGMQPSNENDKLLQKEKFLTENSMMQLKGFKFEAKAPVSATQNEFGIKACINWDSSGVMCYEALVPFKTFFKKRISLSDSTKTFGLSVIVNALPMPTFSQGDRPEMGGGGMPAGGPPRGEMPGGPPPEMGNDGMPHHNFNSDAINIKIKFKIAVKYIP